LRELKAVFPWAGLVLVLDQASKWYLVAKVPLNSGFEVTSFFNLVHVRNPGAAFGLLSGLDNRYLMLGLTILALIMILVLFLRFPLKTRWAAVGMGLAVGGALGNLIDRFRFGQVTDFLDFHMVGYHWPVFNLADAALTCGFIILGLIIIRRA
jgi:signal peptidase II